MHVDISRTSFDASKHFSRVIGLQGRVQLDADDIENDSILLHYLRTVVLDLVGPAACPSGSAGFGLDVVAGADPADLSVGRGRIYVDGLLVENDADTTYLDQPDGYVDRDVDTLPGAAYVAYLRAWERGITFVEEPSIREIALGDPGPDSAARAKVLWQIAPFTMPDKFGAGVKDQTAADEARKLFWEWAATLQKKGVSMSARAKRPPSDTIDACNTPPESRYRGVENQLYRVEIHASGVAAAAGPQQAAPAKPLPKDKKQAAAEPVATFVWSRDNGSIVAPVVEISGLDITVADLGRDAKQSFEVGDWVELVDDASACRVADDDLTTSPPPLFTITAIDTFDRIVTVTPDPSNATAGGMLTGTNPELHPLLRRWDHMPPTDADAVPVVEGRWIDLEDGIQVMFTPSPAGTPATYRRGDYWQVPARTIIGDVLAPHDDSGPLPMPPAGVGYHYAPLAYISAAGTIVDLRATFAPLAT